MPNCRECGSRLSRFDKDRCPVCGCKDPFKGVSSETMDITQEIDSIDPKELNYKRCSRKQSMLLAMFLGWSGAPYFYLSYIKYGIIHLLSLLVINLTLLLVTILAHVMPIWLMIVLVISTCLISDVILGLVLYFKPDLKDGRGEYLG